MDKKLDLILETLQTMNGKIDSLASGQKELNHQVGSIESEIQSVKSQMNNRFDGIETNMSHIQDDVSDIKDSVHRIEINESKDILAMLKQIN